MSESLITALTRYHGLMEQAITDSAIVVPSEFNFVPGLGDDLEFDDLGLNPRYNTSLSREPLGTWKGFLQALYRKRLLRQPVLLCPRREALCSSVPWN